MANFYQIIINKFIYFFAHYEISSKFSNYILINNSVPSKKKYRNFIIKIG